MNKKEAIETLKYNYPKTVKLVNGRYVGGFDDTECKLGQALTIAIKALEKENQEIQWLEWENGKEWGEIVCPMLENKPVMTYYAEDKLCYYSYTAPFIDDDVCYYRFDHDIGSWDDCLFVINDDCTKKKYYI